MYQSLVITKSHFRSKQEVFCFDCQTSDYSGFMARLSWPLLSSADKHVIVTGETENISDTVTVKLK